MLVHAVFGGADMGGWVGAGSRCADNRILCCGHGCMSGDGKYPDTATLFVSPVEDGQYKGGMGCVFPRVCVCRWCT